MISLNSYLQEEDFYKEYLRSLPEYEGDQEDVHGKEIEQYIKELRTTHYCKNEKESVEETSNKEQIEKSVNNFLKKKILEFIDGVKDKNEEIDANKSLLLNSGILKGRTMCDYQHKNGNYKLFKPKHDFLLFGSHFSKKDNLIRKINEAWDRYKRDLNLSGPIKRKKHLLFDKKWRNKGGPIEPKSAPHECYNEIVRLCCDFAKKQNGHIAK